MIEIVEVTFIEKPETSDYVLYRSSSTSTYVTTSKDDSTPDPSCLGQMMKNNIIIY